MSDVIERLAMPIRLDPRTGRLATVEQDSDADIGQCIRAVFDTRPGDRWDVPDMGVIDDTFTEQPLDVDTLVDVVSEFEPRAQVLADSNPSAVDALIVDMTLSWQPRSETDA